MIEKRRLIMDNPDHKIREKLRNTQEKARKDILLQQAIYASLEIMRRRDDEYDALKEYPELLEYLGEPETEIMDSLKNMPIENVYRTLRRALRFIPHLAFIINKIIEDTDETIFLDLDYREFGNILGKFTFNKPANEEFENPTWICHKTSENGETVFENSDKRKIVSISRANNQPEKQIVHDVISLYQKADDSSYSNPERGTAIITMTITENLADDIRKEADFSLYDEIYVLLKDNVRFYSDKELLNSQLHKLVEYGLLDSVIGRDEEFSSNFILIINKDSDRVKIYDYADMIQSINSRSRSVSLRDYLNHKNSYRILTESEAKEFDYHKTKSLFVDERIISKETIRLGDICTMRNGYGDCFYEDYDYEGDDLSFPIDRTMLDDYGMIRYFIDPTRLKYVDAKKYKASLLKDKDVFITRKGSCIKTGIFEQFRLNELETYHINDKPIKAYIFGAPIILHAKEGISPWYLLACMHYLLDKGIIKNGKNKSAIFFTSKELEEMQVPKLEDIQMEKFVENYRDEHFRYTHRQREMELAEIKMKKLVNKL